MTQQQQQQHQQQREQQQQAHAAQVQWTEWGLNDSGSPFRYFFANFANFFIIVIISRPTPFALLLPPSVFSALLLSTLLCSSHSSRCNLKIDEFADGKLCLGAGDGLTN